MDQRDRAVTLFGTDETLAAPEVITAGALSLELEAGALRHITFDGVEVIRGIAFLIRNVSWGTYRPEIANLEVNRDPDGFRASYDARCADESQAFRYHADITYTEEDGLMFAVTGRADGPFHTNRLGFVVLHPLVGVAGAPVQVTHVDGSIAEGRFPRLVSPAQPFFDIRALRHQVGPGVWATCTMTGDAYEMEDQRNWTDASYKTYIRPLSKPLPYAVEADEEVVQTIALTFETAVDRPPAASAESGIALTCDTTVGGVLPKIGLALTPEINAATRHTLPAVRGLGAQFLVCSYDGRQGADALAAYRELAEDLKASVTLELVLPAVDSPDTEAKAAAAAVAAAGLEPEAVSVCPAPLLMSYQPDAVWPDIPPLSAFYSATRAAFPRAAIGGGTLSYFTELNRCWPPAEGLDYITHTTSATVHDADDRAVMETLEALPYAIETTRARFGALDYRIGPSAIGMRHNPYGADVAANPDNRRVAMARDEPRHRALFGAAWTLAYAAAATRGQISALTLAAPVGPFGVVHNGAWPAPYYDRHDDAKLYPLYHVLRGLAGAAGRPFVSISSTAPAHVDGIAWHAGDHIACWLANLTSEPISVDVASLTGAPLSLAVLDEDSFAVASTSPDYFTASAQPAPGTALTLKPYAVAALRLSSA